MGTASHAKAEPTELISVTFRSGPDPRPGECALTAARSATLTQGVIPLPQLADH